MAMEPITLFSRIADPALVAGRLRELVPGVKIDGPDQSWRNAVVTFGSWWKKRTLTLTHDPDYYTEPNWSQQMSGMQGYFSGFPESDRKPRVLMLISTFKFSLGALFAPDFDPNGDPRLDILFALADTLDGVLFTPSSLRDAHGRILLSIDGEEDEDPHARWPRVAAEVSMSDMQAQTDDGSTPDPPTAERVARRALAMTALTTRAILEREVGQSHAEESYQDLLEWIEECGIHDEIEPDEWAVLQRPLGKLDGQTHLNSVWRLEGLVVLAWALNRFDIPPHDQLVEVNPLWESLGVFNIEAAQELLANPTLRSRDQIETQHNQLFALHWRLRNYHLHPEAMNFAEYARTCWFGPLDISELPLIGGDLALQGKRIDSTSAELFSTAHSAAQERHQAINWLWEGPERYSDASVAT